jgi:PAS domain S-box-containing protein
MTSREESLKLFKTIFDQTPVSTQVLSPDGYTVMVNKAWEKLWNVKFSQLGSYNMLKDKQLEATGTMPYIRRGFKGEIVNIPAIRYDPAKTIDIKGANARWLSARMYPIKNSKGKISYLVLQHEDITERKNFEENLKESQERLRATWDSATDAMSLSDPNGMVIDANQAYFSLYGYSRDEVVGKKFSIIFPKKIRKWAEDSYRSTFDGKLDSAEVEAKVVSKDGKEHIVISQYSFLIKDGKRIAMLSVVRDVTQRKKDEQALLESEERLRIALEAGNIGVWDWNIPQNTLKWTDNVYKIHGVSKEKFEVNFKNFYKLIHPDDRNFLEEALEKTLTKGSPFSIQFRIIDNKGGVRWLTTSAVLLYESNGKPFRLLGATSDITQQKLIEQEKSDFLSMAAHELKTPITSMNMFVDLISREVMKLNHEKSSYFAKRIKEQTDRLSELTGDLLDVSRIETGKLKLNKSKFKLSELIEDTVEALQSTTSHNFIIDSPIDSTVNADKYRIYQVIVNLLTNAIKYSSPDKNIVVSVKEKNGELITGVRDYGIGISKDKHDKIFDRLYQVTDPKEKTFPGLGLGLYISKEIVERHGGKIWLKSKKGEGSTFYFSLNK